MSQPSEVRSDGLPVPPARDAFTVSVSHIEREKGSKLNIEQVEKSWAAESSSIACLFSFPFPIYVDTASRFTPVEERIATETVRFYPFFRSGPANYSPAPPVDLCQIPQPIGNRFTDTPSRYLPSPVAVPTLAGEPTGSVLLNLTSSWDNPPRFFPMDSARIDLLGANHQHPRIASEIVNQLLRHVRVKTRQWWIGHGLPTGAEYYLRQIFPISRKGAFKGGPESNGSFRTLRGDEVPLDHSIWHRAIRSIQNDETIADYEDLLLDARYHTAKTEIRRAIIDLAVACEQACEATFVQIVRERNMSSFRRGRYYTGNDLTKHLNQDL